MANRHTRTQTDKILSHLNTYGSITTYEAFKRYNITRLSARIFDIRKRGYMVGVTQVTKKNDEGNTVTYAKYTLLGVKE